MGLGGHMTEKEKEIYKFLDDSAIAHEDVTNKELLEVAKALIQRYPQILAEKVWEGHSPLDFHDRMKRTIKPEKYAGKKIEVFIRESKE
jgi:hypothetical protein